MSDNEDYISTTSDHNKPAQTAENTTTPFEPEVAFGSMKLQFPASNVPPVGPPKKKRKRLSVKERAAKIAAGWNPPGPKPGYKPIRSIETQPRPAPKPKGPSQADIVLKSLVDKLVAIENDAQYRAVWSHYFVHGGVYLGPKYVDELTAAIQYLIRTESAQTTVGEQS